jgi:adenylyltransferase/sulfurtransferase
VLLGKPNVHGSVFRFEGQVSVFDARFGPCYRCLYPEPPPPGLIPNCAEGGVLGVLPGVIGVIQGIETLKLLLGIGESLMGRLLVFDALAMSFRELRLRKDPACPLCGENPRITELQDYEELCGVASETSAGSSDRVGELEIGAREVASLRQRDPNLQIVDVREPHEHAIARIEGAILIPLRTLPERMRELDPDRSIVLHCHHGVRSLRATELLRGSGFARAKSLRGGIDAWSREVDSTVPRY